MIGLRVRGFPHDVNNTHATFSVTVTHFLTDAVVPTTLTIHAQLLPSPQWPSPSDHLPLLIQHVQFSGELSSVKDGEVIAVVDVLMLILCKCLFPYHPEKNMPSSLAFVACLSWIIATGALLNGPNGRSVLLSRQ